MYLLVAGIFLGVLMGPAVLGRLSPSIYENTFVGGAELTEQIAQSQAQSRLNIQSLEQAGVTDAAIPEQLVLGQNRLVVLQAQLQQAQQQRLTELTGWTTAMMLAVVALMMLEALVSPDTSIDRPTQVAPALGRLITARYALTALWLAVMIAQPKLLAQLPIVFTGLLIVVALVAALVPLGPGKKHG